LVIRISNNRHNYCLDFLCYVWNMIIPQSKWLIIDVHYVDSNYISYDKSEMGCNYDFSFHWSMLLELSLELLTINSVLKSSNHSTGFQFEQESCTKLLWLCFVLQNGTAPLYLRELFTNCQSQYRRRLRFSSSSHTQFDIPSTNSKLADRSLAIVGP
jgi:hypothetical protein